MAGKIISRIRARRESKKKQRMNQIIVGGILVLVMLMSVLGYAFQGGSDGSSEEIEYNGFKFVEQDGYWFTNFEDRELIFLYNPLEIDEKGIGLKTFENYESKPLYIYSENTPALGEIYRNLEGIYQRIQFACPEGKECEEDVPEKSCENNFIIIKISQENKIVQENNCVFIEGVEEDLAKLSDEFLFEIFSIV